MFLSNTESKCCTPTSITSPSIPTSTTSNYPRAVRALTSRYTEKAAKMGIGMEWIDQKVLEDVEIVRKEYMSTGKGEPSDEFIVWFYDVQEYDRDMHSPTTNSSMNLPKLLPENPLPTYLTHDSPTPPKSSINQATEAEITKQSPVPNPSSRDKCLEASSTAPAYTSFSALGLQEPEGPKSLEVTSEEDSSSSSPRTALQKVKSALVLSLGLESNQK
ncbi:hypothetical protein SBOR_4967 [Sclerotinia borealis F-4128]|uniref:Uncharacterized protein n=1 Tax=Sclerotinia borealis (strain F-4128) TaxID=1432307 RepID=W9CFH3_SCLBF|nr:hypothetical protein SBOR_4967 [Sclerotinia borealis F-4128]